MEKLDAILTATLQAANISEALLPTLSCEDIPDLFPGPERFLRREAVWNLFHKEQEVHSNLISLHCTFTISIQSVLTNNSKQNHHNYNK
ncbi:hypothetical protein MHYP_G00362790 [Metynnis hypsauchen]